MDARQFLGSSKYLKAADLRGQTVSVTIASCAEETIGQGREAEQKCVLYFQGKEKGLVLNATNTNTIADLLGFETQVWVGNHIELYTIMTEYQGKPQEGLRVRMLSSTPATPLLGTATATPAPIPAVPPPGAFAATPPAAAAPAQGPSESEIPF